MKEVTLSVYNKLLENEVLTPNIPTRTNLNPKHNFLEKLMQPSVLPHLQSYVLWQSELRQNPKSPSHNNRMPDTAPISINLDPTSACNYACPHCVDMDILNTGVQYDWDHLRSSLDLMHDKGLRSVIIIGGGEPTLYKQFTDLVNFVKDKEMEVAVVSNGTGMERIEQVAHRFGPKDWVRLSLDSASEEKFQRMHLPKGKMARLPIYSDTSERQKPVKTPITLAKICDDVESVRTAHPNLTIGFSYIVTWPGARTNDQEIESNLDEMFAAAQLAKSKKFSYFAEKAFLDRDATDYHAEIIGIDKNSQEFPHTRRIMSEGIEKTKELEDENFSIMVSTNLAALLDGSDNAYRHQPVHCHMTNFRQVLGIRGVSICPVYREEPQAKVGDMDAYWGESNFQQTRTQTAEKIRNFDASLRCHNVVCMYMDANWAIERLIQQAQIDPSNITQMKPGPERNDYFL
jgi:organic radical activating enzyme